MKPPRATGKGKTHMARRIRLGFWLGVVAIWACAAPAAAQAPPAQPADSRVAPLSETLTGEARSDYDAGRILLRDHDAAAALIRFSAAYRRTHDPRLLANIALSEKSLNHPARAATLLTQLLAQSSPSFTVEQRDQLRELFSSCLSSVGRLRVSLDQSEASVWVDDRPVVASELGSDLFLDAGLHRVRASLVGYRDFVQDLAMASGGRATVMVKLEPDARLGTLRVRATAQAGIAVDGQVVATGAWVGPVAAGGHQVDVTAAGMTPYRADVTLADHETRTLDVTLVPDAADHRTPVWLWVAGGAVLGAAVFVAADSVFR